jgi:trigger factor
LPLVEGCRYSLDITIPVDEVESETNRAVSEVQKKARIKGFRPGKVPPSLIREHFGSEVRQKVFEALVPKHLQKQYEAENLNVVSSPDISKIHYHTGEPLTFHAEFEIAPTIELGDYKDVEVPYHDPEITDDNVNQEIERLRDSKADYVNIDPRPLENGDHAVVSLESLSGVDEPMKADELVVQLGGEDTLAGFTENLLGMTPGEEKDFDVQYPEEYGGNAKLAGRTVRFHATLKGIRRKDLPELNDDFAQDVGDFRNLEELRDSVKKQLFVQQQQEAQSTAKNEIVKKLVETHEFPVPEAFIDRQIKNRVEQWFAQTGIDPRKANLDWEKLKASQRETAIPEVKAALLLSRIAEREAIGATHAEVDREVEKIARRNREPLAATQRRLEANGGLRNIASHIQTEKTLSFLFEHARKTA